MVVMATNDKIFCSFLSKLDMAKVHKLWNLFHRLIVYLMNRFMMPIISSEMFTLKDDTSLLPPVSHKNPVIKRGRI